MFLLLAALEHRRFLPVGKLLSSVFGFGMLF
jgi:hypothetical protein